MSLRRSLRPVSLEDVEPAGVGERMANLDSPRPYRGVEMAVVVPTKDRPEKLRNLLDSLAKQDTRIGRVIIVDGSESAEPVVRDFEGTLGIEYYRFRPPGQLTQRDFGLSKLGESERLVALLDDDIVLEPGAVHHMLEMWNRVEPRTAGICFNIVNGKPESFSWPRYFLGLTTSEPGRVLRSGMTTSNTHAEQDSRTQWLPGGATVWQRALLKQRMHQEITCRWAIAEDLIFSYPIGKVRPLYVCASARVRHEHDFDYNVSRPHKYHGRTQTLWLFYFVKSNPDLSALLCLWTLGVRVGGHVSRSLVSGETRHLQFALGQVSAVAAILRQRLLGRPFVDLLREPAASQEEPEKVKR